MHFMISCIINWLQFDSFTFFTFSRVCLVNKNDCVVLYTCPVETHFWLVNPYYVLAIWLLTSKVKFEPWRGWGRQGTLSEQYRNPQNVSNPTLKPNKPRIQGIRLVHKWMSSFWHWQLRADYCLRCWYVSFASELYEFPLSFCPP